MKELLRKLQIKELLKSRKPQLIYLVSVCSISLIIYNIFNIDILYFFVYILVNSILVSSLDMISLLAKERNYNYEEAPKWFYNYCNIDDINLRIAKDCDDAKVGGFYTSGSIYIPEQVCKEYDLPKLKTLVEHERTHHYQPSVLQRVSIASLSTIILFTTGTFILYPSLLLSSILIISSPIVQEIIISSIYRYYEYKTDEFLIKNKNKDFIINYILAISKNCKLPIIVKLLDDNLIEGNVKSNKNPISKDICPSVRVDNIIENTNIEKEEILERIINSEDIMIKNSNDTISIQREDF